MALNLNRSYGNASQGDIFNKLNNLFGWYQDPDGTTKAYEGEGRFSVLQGTPQMVSGGGQMDAVPVKIHDAQTGQSIDLDLRTTGGNQASGGGYGLGYVVGSGMYAEGGYFWGQKSGDNVQIQQFAGGDAFLNRLTYAFDRSQSRGIGGREFTAQEMFFQSINEGGFYGGNAVAGGLPFINAYDVGAQSRSWAENMAPVFMDHGIHQNQFSDALSTWQAPLSPAQIHMGMEAPSHNNLFFSGKQNAVVTPGFFDATPMAGGNMFSLHGDKIKDASLLRRQTVGALNPALTGLMTPQLPGVGNNADLAWGQSSAIMPGDTGSAAGLFGHVAVPQHGLVTYSGGSVLDPRRYQQDIGAFGFEKRISSRQSSPLSLSQIEGMVPGAAGGQFGLQMHDFMAEGARRTFAPGETFSYASVRGEGGEWTDITHTVGERPLTIMQNPQLSLPLGASQQLQDSLTGAGIGFNIRGEVTSAGRQASIVMQGMQQTDVAMKGFGKDFPFAFNFAEGQLPNAYTGQGGAQTRIDMLSNWRSPELGALRMVGGLAPEKMQALMGEFGAALPGIVGGDNSALQQAVTAGSRGHLNVPNISERFASEGRNFSQDFYTFFNSRVNPGGEHNQRWLNEYGIGTLANQEMFIGRFSESNKQFYEDRISRAGGNNAALGLRFEKDGDQYRAYQRDNWLVGPQVSTLNPEYTGGAMIGLPMLGAMEASGFGGFAKETGLSYMLDPNNSLTAPADLRAFRHIDAARSSSAFDQRLGNARTMTANDAFEMQRFMTTQLKDIEDPKQQLAAFSQWYGENMGEFGAEFTSMDFGAAGSMPDPRAIGAIDHATADGTESISLQPTKYMNAMNRVLSGAGSEGFTRAGTTGQAIREFQSSWKQFSSKSDLLKRILGREPGFSMSGRYRGATTIDNNNSVYLSNERMYRMFQSNRSIRNDTGNPMAIADAQGRSTNFGNFLSWVGSQGGIGGLAGRDPNTEPGSPDAPGMMPVRFKTQQQFAQEYPEVYEDTLFQKQGIVVGPGFSEWFYGDKDADPARFFSQLTGSGPGDWAGPQDPTLNSQIDRYQDPGEYAGALGRIEQRRMSGLTPNERSVWNGGSTLVGDMAKILERRSGSRADLFEPRGKMMQSDEMRQLITSATDSKYQMGTAYNNFLRGIQVSAATSGYGAKYAGNSANMVSMQYQYALDSEREGNVLPEQMYQSMVFVGGDNDTAKLWFKSGGGKQTVESPEQLRRALIRSYASTEGIGPDFLAHGFSESPENEAEIAQMLGGVDVSGMERSQMAMAYSTALEDSPLVGRKSLLQRHHMARALSKYRDNQRGVEGTSTFGGKTLSQLSHNYDPQIEMFNLVARSQAGDPDLLARAAIMAQGTTEGRYVSSYLQGGSFDTNTMRFSDFESTRTLEPHQVVGGKIVDPLANESIIGRKGGDYTPSSPDDIPFGVTSRAGGSRGTTGHRGGGSGDDPPNYAGMDWGLSPDENKRVDAAVNKISQNLRVQANVDLRPKISGTGEANAAYASLKDTSQAFRLAFGSNRGWLGTQLSDAGLLEGVDHTGMETPQQMMRTLSAVQGAIGEDDEKMGKFLSIMGSRRLGPLAKLGASIQRTYRNAGQIEAQVDAGVVEFGSDMPGATVQGTMSGFYGQVDLGARISSLHKAATQSGFAEGKSGGPQTYSDEFIEAQKDATAALKRASEHYTKASESRNQLTQQEETLKGRMAELEGGIAARQGQIADLQTLRESTGDADQSAVLGQQISQMQSRSSRDQARLGSMGRDLDEMQSMGPVGRRISQMSQNLFGGFSMMYLRRLGAITGQAMSIGDKEAYAMQSARRQAGAAVFGTGAVYQDPNVMMQHNMAGMGTGGLTALKSSLSGAAGPLGGALIGGAVAGAAGVSLASSNMIGLAGMLGTTSGALAGILGPAGVAAGIGVNLYGMASDPLATMGKAVGAGTYNTAWASLGLGLANRESLEGVLAPGASADTQSLNTMYGVMQPGVGGGRLGETQVGDAIGRSTEIYSQAAEAVRNNDQRTLTRLGFDTATSLQMQVVGGEIADDYAPLGDAMAARAGFTATQAVMQGARVNTEANMRAWSVGGMEARQNLFAGMTRFGGAPGAGQMQGAWEQLYGQPGLTEVDIRNLNVANAMPVSSKMMSDWGYGADEYGGFMQELSQYAGGSRDQVQRFAAMSQSFGGASRFGGTSYSQDILQGATFRTDSMDSATRLDYERAMAGSGMVAQATQGLMAGGANLSTLQSVENMTSFGGLAAAQQLGGMASQRAMYGLSNNWGAMDASTVALAQTQTGMAQQLVGRGIDPGMAAMYAGTPGSVAQANLYSGTAQMNPSMMAISMAKGGPNPVQMLGLGAATGGSFADMQTMEVSQGSRGMGLFPMYTHGVGDADMSQIFGEGWQDDSTLSMLAEGGTRALKEEQMAINKSNAGLGAARAALSFAFTTGVGLDRYQTRDPRTGKRFDIPEGGAWGLQERQMNLGFRQQEYNLDYQEQSQDMQRSQFYENAGLQRTQQLMQREWKVEDWAFQDQTRGLQWSWQQEDHRENVRFQTGRQRKISERQMGRSTIMHNLQEENIDKQRERQQEIWRMEDRKHQMSIEHFEEQATLQDERLEKMREFYEESKKLQTDQFELQKAQFIESNKLIGQSSAAITDALGKLGLDMEDRGGLAALAASGQYDAETSFGPYNKDPRGNLLKGGYGDIGARQETQDAWNNDVLANLKAIAEQTKDPQQIHLKVQLPGGEFRTFVLDVVEAELDTRYGGYQGYP